MGLWISSLTGGGESSRMGVKAGKAHFQGGPNSGKTVWETPWPNGAASLTLQKGRVSGQTLCSSAVGPCRFLGALPRFPGWSGLKAALSSGQGYKWALLPGWHDRTGNKTSKAYCLRSQIGRTACWVSRPQGSAPGSADEWRCWRGFLLECCWASWLPRCSSQPSRAAGPQVTLSSRQGCDTVSLPRVGRSVRTGLLRCRYFQIVNSPVLHGLWLVEFANVEEPWIQRADQKLHVD